MPTRIMLSTSGTGLGPFVGTGGVFRKDFIRAGEWTIKQGGKLQKLEVSEDRIKQWEETFKLFRERGISVPLTVDHISVRDPKTGKVSLRKMTPGMAEAKRGSVVNLFGIKETGYCEVVPADTEAETLMARCPEVSLELEYDVVDGHGNHYDEAITAITLTPIPVVPGQQLEWEKVSSTVDGLVVASRDPRDGSREVVCLSAEPLIASRASSQENSMSPTHLERLRKALAMPNDPETEVHAKAVDHIETCRSGRYMSREDHEKALAEAVKTAKAEGEAKVVTLSRELETAKTGTRVITVAELAKTIDEDGLEMAADGIKTRIKALGNKATPKQKELLMSRLVGESGKRPVIALSRKAATTVGLPDRLADMVLSIFEAGDPAEMAKLLKEQSGDQKDVKLSRDDKQGDINYDPEVTKRMVSRINNGAEKGAAGFVM